MICYLGNTQQVGTANAVVGGWGNLGGGVTQVLMVAIFAAFVNSGMTEEQAWRRSFTIPAAMLVATAVIIYFLGCDTPRVSGGRCHSS